MSVREEGAEGNHIVYTADTLLSAEKFKGYPGFCIQRRYSKIRLQNAPLVQCSLHGIRVAIHNNRANSSWPKGQTD